MAINIGKLFSACIFSTSSLLPFIYMHKLFWNAILPATCPHGRIKQIDSSSHVGLIWKETKLSQSFSSIYPHIKILFKLLFESSNNLDVGWVTVSN